MYCSQCGIKSLADAKFCIECGSSLNLPETTPKSSEKVDVKGIEESVTEAPPDKIVATEERINQDKANTQEEVDTQEIKIQRVKADGGKSKKKKIFMWVVIICLPIFILPFIFDEEETGGSSVGSQDSVSSQNQPIKTESVAPIIFSSEQASSFLLKPDDFPKNWTAKKSGMILEAQNDYLSDFNVKKIKITLEIQETEADAQAAFSAKKSEAQTTIDERGISGDKLEDVKKYALFVWNASSQANIDGVEKWTVIGVYGNITMKVYHEGSMGAPKKNFAVDIAKKQMDRLKSD